MNAIVAYIIVAIIGVVKLCFPEVLYTLTIGWKFNSRDGSPDIIESLLVFAA